MEDMGRPYSQDYHRLEQDFLDAMEIRRMDAENAKDKGAHALAFADKKQDATAQEIGDTGEVFCDDSGIAWVMAPNRKVDDARRDEDVQEQKAPCEKRSRRLRKEGPKGARPKSSCWRFGKPHLQRDCLQMNDEGRERAWPTSGAWRS